MAVEGLNIFEKLLSACEFVRYKRNIQNRKIQSKRVLGLMKYTHRLADHNKVTQ